MPLKLWNPMIPFSSFEDVPNRNGDAMIFSQKPKNDKKPKLVEFFPISLSMTLKGFQKHAVKLRPKFGALRYLSSILVLGASF